ncbi:salicylate hydroxylase [Thozetella sp. PMI_491]|nr:salicylate hydroxylase [Thozetella sp. PMI_491]
MANQKIRVAIIGGGIAGATCANALVPLPHLDVQVFESAPEFSERGAAVGLAENAQVALQHVIPSALELLARGRAVTVNNSRVMLGSGPQAGNIVLDLADADDPGVNIHRASLLRELLAILPPDILHPSKKLQSIKEQNGDNLVLHFEDGTAGEFDVVIGADGLFSSVRNHVLQNKACECASSPAGFWDARALVPYEKAKAAIGDQFFERDLQYSWIGNGAVLIHDILDNRTTVQCIVSAVEKDLPHSNDDRSFPLTRDVLLKTLEGWEDGPIAKPMIELILEYSNKRAYSQFEHKSTPTYVRGRVCIIGDAAHGTTPWQGSGAAMAFEDAAVLGALFGSVTTRDDLGPALCAYDAIRRPRGQRVIDSSRGTGRIFCGQDELIGLDPQKFLGAVATRWTFITELDLGRHKEEARALMKKFQAEQKLKVLV